MTDFSADQVGSLVLDKDARDRMMVGNLALDLVSSSLHPGLRRYSAEHIRDFGVAGERALEALTHSLRDPNKWVRLSVVITIGRLGPIAADAVKELVFALQNSEEMVRQYIPEALARINCPSYSVLTALFAAQYDRHETTALCASKAFDDLYLIADPKDKDRVADLVEVKARSIDIRELPKALLLQNLFNSVPPNLSRFFREQMTYVGAQKLISHRLALIVATNGGAYPIKAEELQFSNLLGRKLPIDLAAPFLDPKELDEYYDSPGLCERVVNKTRQLPSQRDNWLSRWRERGATMPFMIDR